MRILVCLHDYLPLHKGGSEVHAHQTAAELVRRGHDVTSLFTERDLSAEVGSLRRGEMDGVKTIEAVHQREYADVRETWEERGSLELFRQLMAELSPEVVHFHHLAIWGSGCLRVAKEAGARVVVTLHDYHLLCDVATLLRPDGSLCDDAASGDCTACLRRHPALPERWDGKDAEEIWPRAVRERLDVHRRDLACADEIIAPSHFLLERFAEAGFLEPARCTVAKAGYPGPVREPRRRDPARPLRAGYVGGIYPSKGVHVLMDAMARLGDAPVELDVHGHLDWFPDYVEDLRRRADGAAVRFHGPFDPPRLDEILATLDCLVVPSIWYENMPITVHEAFRNGIPVVATDLGGMAECVPHDVAGLTFPRADDRALAEALRRLAEEPGLYDRLAAGRPHVPGLGEIVDGLEALYRGG